MFDKEPAALFIDGANLAAAMKLCQMELDFKLMLSHFKKKYVLRRAYYYTALLNDNQNSGVRSLVDWLDFNGFSTVTKQAKEYRYHDRHTNREVVTVKGNMDIEMTVDMLRMAPNIKHLHLFTGDGDFAYAIRELQNMGIRVTAYSTMKTNEFIKFPMVAFDLRKQVDEFVDLSEWVAKNNLQKEKF